MAFRQAIPGLLIYLTSFILLALVSFNTPLIKSLSFLEATYNNGGIGAKATFGTMGYCYDYSYGSSEASGTSSCTGPQIGYTIDVNTIFGTTGINIPDAVAKSLTYVLVLHIVALVLSFVSIIFTALDYIPGFSLLCFPACFTWLTSSITLLAFIFDLAIFYIAKAKIDGADGASATIGPCVWMTLAAWLLTAFAGCLNCFGKCCDTSNRRRDRGDRDRSKYKNVDAAAAEEYNMDPQRPLMTTGPPIREPPKSSKLLNVGGEREVSVPLTSGPRDDDEPKYLQDEADHEYNNNYAGHGADVTSVPYNDASPPRRQPSRYGYGHGQRGISSSDEGAHGYNGGQYYNSENLASGQPNMPAYYPESRPTTAGSLVGVGAHSGAGQQYIPPVPPLSGGGGGATPGSSGYIPGQQRQSSWDQGQGNYGSYYPDQQQQQQQQYGQAYGTVPIPQPQPHSSQGPTSPISSGGNHQYQDPYGANIPNAVPTGYSPTSPTHGGDVGYPSIPDTYSNYVAPMPTRLDTQQQPSFPLNYDNSQAGYTGAQHQTVTGSGDPYNPGQSSQTNAQDYAQAYGAHIDDGHRSVGPPSYSVAAAGHGDAQVTSPSSGPDKQTYFR